MSSSEHADTQEASSQRIEHLSGEAIFTALPELLELASRVQQALGKPPFSDQTLAAIKSVRSSERLVDVYLAQASSPHQGLKAAAVVVKEGDGSGVLELAVIPAERSLELDSSLLTAVASTQDLSTLDFWVHGDHDAAAEVAGKFGFVAVRELWREQLDAQDYPAAEQKLMPDGVTLTVFVPGQDENAWLEANAAAFAHHPEQGSMTLADLLARESELWFDPAGFFLAKDGAGKILGFNWTKVQNNGAAPTASIDANDFEASDTVAEIYAVGVTPEAQGLGLGALLTRRGIEHLIDAGHKRVILYVDADNIAAVALYRKLGFRIADQDHMYRLLRQS